MLVTRRPRAIVLRAPRSPEWWAWGSAPRHVTLVRACDWPYAYLYNPHQRLDMGWGFLYDDTAAIRVLSTPGDHCTVLTEQYAAALAESLAAVFTGNVGDTSKTTSF